MTRFKSHLKKRKKNGTFFCHFYILLLQWKTTTTKTSI